MFILDSILTSPFKGLLWVFQEVHKAAQEEMDRQAESITSELMELHKMLEAGKIAEADFDLKEKELLDQLDKLEGEEGDLEEELEGEEDLFKKKAA